MEEKELYTPSEVAEIANSLYQIVYWSEKAVKSKKNIKKNIGDLVKVSKYMKEIPRNVGAEVMKQAGITNEDIENLTLNYYLRKNNYH